MNNNILLSNNRIEISFTGKDVKPETVKASDIADILRAVERMVESQVYRDHPDIDKEQVIVGFVNIKSGSIDLQFASPLDGIVLTAFRSIGYAVNTNNFSELPAISLEDLDTIISFTRKKQCTAEFVTIDGQRNVLAKISPDTTITRPPYLTGETTIYGQIVRVGGRTPRVMVELLNGQTIFCEAAEDIAKKLGEKLYRVAGLSGTASWDAKSLILERFIIREVTAYEDLPLEDAIKQLAQVAGKYYSGVDDVPKYISNIRVSGAPE